MKDDHRANAPDPPRYLQCGLCYTPEGDFLVGLYSGRRLRIWATSDLRERYHAPLPGILYSHRTLQLSGDLAFLSQGKYSLARVWQALRATTEPIREKHLIEELHTLAGVPRFEMVLSPDGSMTAEILHDYHRPIGELVVRDRRGEVRQRFAVERWARHVVISPDNRRAVLVWRNRALLYDLDQRKVIDELSHTDVTNRALFSPDGSQLAVAAGRSLWLWDLATKKGERFPAFQTFVEALAYSPDGTQLAAADRMGEIRVLEPASGKQRGCLNFEVGAIHDLAFSPDGMTVAGAGHNSAVVVWDLE